MADKTGIEWSDATWNPIVGCSLASPGCTNCYAMRQAARIERMTPGSHYAGTTQPSKAGAVWTGKVTMAPDHILLQPLRWKRPRRIFVNSMGDLFHESVTDAQIDRVFAVMTLASQHAFQVLTKRSARMRAYLSHPATARRIYEEVCDLTLALNLHVVLIADPAHERDAPAGQRVHLGRWPLPNVWLGVSAEDQVRADERIPDLLATPAAVRFVSAEPLLGPIDIRRWMYDWGCEACGYGGHETKDHCPNCGWIGDAAEEFSPCPECGQDLSDYYACPECEVTNEGGFGPTPSGYIDWIIVGGESGSGARPMHPDWARSLRDQCEAAGVPFFMKQMGGPVKSRMPLIPDDLMVRQMPKD